VKIDGNTNHRELFGLGIVFMGAGIAIGQIWLIGLGAIFFITGITNRKSWEEGEAE